MMARVAARLALAVLLVPLTVSARPLYFDTITNLYGLTPADDIYACGICHQRWGGTGARNPFGFAIEQQLYIGKSITDAIMTVAPGDEDLDGFSNDDELAIHRTLPGYSCANYEIAEDTPPNFQTLITPGVPSCLEPKDIKVEPLLISFSTEVGDVDTAMVEIRNNGDTFPIEVTGVALVAGAPPSLGISAPALPLSIPIGGSATVQVTYSPTVSLIESATLRITSDDPDEPTIDVDVFAVSIVVPLAPPEVRGACLKDLEKGLERLTKTRLRAWGKCYVDELSGAACDAARRDQSVAKAEDKLRAVVGGAKDQHCAAESLSAILLGLPPQCPAPCDFTMTTIAKVADCAVCQATAATDGMLTAVVGTTPPDFPQNQLGADALRCNSQLVKAMERAIRTSQKSLARCELPAVLAGTSPDCPIDIASTLAVEAAKVDDRAANCADTTGMLGCLFEPGADPTCLGTAATDIAVDLSETVFGPN